MPTPEDTGRPRPRRRLRRHVRRVSAVVALAVTVALALLIHREGRILPTRIAGYVNRHYLAGTPFEFSLDDVSGTFVRRVTFKNPVLRYHGPDASYNVFRADRVSVSYQLFPALAFRLLVDDVEMENVAIHLRQDREGRLVFPGTGVAQERFKKKKGPSPVVDVRQFRVDGLELTYGGNQRGLAVRDVNLQGSFGYERGVGRVAIEQGNAYIADSRTTVSSVRLKARSDWRSIFVDEFAVRLDSSFVMARGEFREGRFQDVEVVTRPVSLEELHQLGVIPDEHGTFDARVSLSGTVDELDVAGTISGTGLGVSLSSVEFQGRATPKVLALDRMRGEVFGSFVDGAFRIEVDSEDFVFDGRCVDLDLSRGFIADEGLPPMALTGRIRVERARRAGRYDWSGVLERAVVDGYETFDVEGEGVWQDGVGLTVYRLSTTRPGYRVEGSGTVADGGPADLVFQVNGTDLGYFWSHFALPPVAGAVALTGRLTGPLDDFQVNVNGPVHDVAWEFARLDSGAVQAEARRVGTPAPEVTVSLQGRRARLWGLAFEQADLLMDADTSAVHVHTVQVARGDSTYRASFDVVTRDGRSRVDLRHAELVAPDAEGWTAAPAVIYAGTGGLVIDTLVVSSARGEFGVSGSRRTAERAIDARVWGRDVDLGVFRDALRVPVPLAGRASFDLDLDGDEDAPRARLRAVASDGVVDSVTFDALRVDVGFDGRRYRLHELWLQSGDDTLSAVGEWSCALSPRVLVRRDRPESLWDAPLSVRGTLYQYDVWALLRAMHRPLALASAYTGQVSIGGTLAQPSVRAQGNLRPRVVPGRALPPVDLDAEYRDGALRVAALKVSHVVDLNATGTLPMTFSFRDGARVETDQPLRLRVDIAPLAGDAPSDFAPYLPAVSVLRGLLSGRLEARGTPESPRLTGYLSFARGELRFPGVQEGGTNVAARLDFVDDVVRLTSLSAASGKKGSVVATGWARVSNYRLVDYRVDVTAREFPVRSIPDVELLLGGALTVRPVDWRDGGRIPSITGAVEVREATIAKELARPAGAAPGSELARPTDRPDWLASIDIDAPKNVWVRNADLNMELSSDALVFVRDERGTYFRGELSVLRGSYKLYGNKFTITSAGMDFSASETLRPSMHFEAYTPHRGGEGQENRIYLVLSWPYDKLEPHISLSYDEPGYSESDIWSMLGGNIFAGGVATNALERAIDAQMTGGFTVDVDQRRVEDPTEAGTESETLIGVGRYLWEDVYLQYRRGLSTGGEQEFNVEYRLSNKFLLRSQFIYNSRRNRAGIVGQNTDEFNLDLKYRFEY